MTLTRHAQARMQQRGFRTQDLEALIDLGSVRPAPGNSEVVLLGKKYAVVADGVIVTVGHRTRRIRRD